MGGALREKGPASSEGTKKTLAWDPAIRENEARSCGPFAWQSNNSIRKFEYPWAYHTIRRQGSHLRVLEVGGGLSGLQFVLAAEGDEVINLDPDSLERWLELRWDLHRRCAVP